MIVRNCSGGIVFVGDKVLIVGNDKQEWGFPKGVVKSDADLSLSAFAKDRVKSETGVDAKVLAPCGKTNYEYYSISRLPRVKSARLFLRQALSSASLSESLRLWKRSLTARTNPF